jgi:lipopolysaccharide exporter
LILPISALNNPAINLYRRNFNYKPIIKLMIYDKIFCLIFVITLAVYLDNYWAMIFGMVASYIFKTIGSFLIHDFKPRWSLKNAPQQWVFSKWLLMKGVIGYTRAEFDTYLVSSIFGVATLGGYNLMKSISSLPAREIIIPATEPLLAGFSQNKANAEKLIYQVVLSCFTLCLLIFPIATFMWTQHYLIVVNIFGEQWVQFSEILGVMSILLFSFSVTAVFQHFLTAVNKVKTLFYFDLVSFIIIIGSLISMTFDSIYEFTVIRSGLAFTATLVFFIFISYKFSLPFLKMIRLVSLISLGSFIPAFILSYFQSPFDNNFLNLIFIGTLYFGIYFAFLFIWSKLSHEDEVLTVKNLINEYVGRLFNRIYKNKTKNTSAS